MKTGVEREFPTRIPKEIAASVWVNKKTFIPGTAIVRAEIVVGKGSDLDLVIAGGTPRDIDKYSRKALSCGVAERTHLIGPWPNSRLGELLAEATIIVSPRIRGINTPMKIFPYLHSGLPVLVTEIPTHTQILDSTVAALAPPDPKSMAAAIIRLERDPELRARLGQAGQAFVESNHTFESHLRRVSELYDYVAEEVL